MLCKFPAATKRLCYHLTQVHMFSEAYMVDASHGTLSKCYQWKLHTLFYEQKIAQTFLYAVWLKYAKGTATVCAQRLNSHSICSSWFFHHVHMDIFTLTTRYAFHLIFSWVYAVADNSLDCRFPLQKLSVWEHKNKIYIRTFLPVSIMIEFMRHAMAFNLIFDSLCSVWVILMLFTSFALAVAQNQNITRYIEIKSFGINQGNVMANAAYSRQFCFYIWAISLPAITVKYRCLFLQLLCCYGFKNTPFAQTPP